MADRTNAVLEWKSPWDLALELSRELVEIDQICQFQNGCLVERKNLLVECFTLRILDPGL